MNNDIICRFINKLLYCHHKMTIFGKKSEKVSCTFVDVEKMYMALRSKANLHDTKTINSQLYLTITYSLDVATKPKQEIMESRLIVDLKHISATICQKMGNLVMFTRK